MDLDDLRSSREILLSGLKIYIHDDPERAIRETKAEIVNCEIEISKLEQDRDENLLLIEKCKSVQPERIDRLDEENQHMGILWTELMDAKDGLNELLTIYDIKSSPLAIFLNDAGKAILPRILEEYKDCKKKIEYAYLIFALDDLNMLATPLKGLHRQTTAIYKALAAEFGSVVGTRANLANNLIKPNPGKLAKHIDRIKNLQ
jgi:hypothetical protein